MYRRYIIVGVFFLLLIGSYFIFFNDKKDNNDYEKYYNSLVEKEDYLDTLDGVNLSIDEIEEASKYNYVITFDGVSEKQSNVKILVLNNNCTKDSVETFPSFGIIDNKDYSLVKGNNNLEKKELMGVNLTIIDSDKIDYLLIYYKANNREQFVRVKVSNYLV